MGWIFAVLMLGWLKFSHGLFGFLPTDGWLTNILRYAPVVVLGGAGWAWWRREWWWPWLAAQLDRHTAAVDRWPVARLGWAIAAAAGVGLFAELVIIRLHASYFQVFAYFKNVSLLSCFLGLGIGYTLGGRRRLFTPLVLPALALQILFMHGLDLTEVARLLHNPVSEELSFGSATANAVTLPDTYGFFVLMFGVNALTFIPLGQLASRLMGRMESLPAYGWNLAGSLAGIGAMFLLSSIWAPPIVWITVMAVVLVPFVWVPKPALGGSVAATLAVVTVLSLPGRITEVDIHSPYQLLTLTADSTSLPKLQVSHVYYQNAMNLDSVAIGADPELQQVQRHYELPYRIRPRPGRVLIVGAGMGNDVAAALRADAGAVDAVEIDPAILRFGELLHPESPYGDPRVTTTVADARRFIRHTGRTYDLIVYGLLDSHSLLSSKVGVRLDSYVYTVEAFREARSRLSDQGMICLTFSVLTEGLGTKLYQMLTAAFDGVPPLVYRTGYNFGFAFVAGEGLAHQIPPTPDGVAEVADVFATSTVDVDVSTDDWPFFYMPARTYPASYALMIAVLLALSLLLIARTTPRMAGGMSWPCFFLGAGFMLIETKGITELALVFGSTWTVIGATIAAILILAFTANTVVIRRGAPTRPVTYGLLLASVAGGLFFTSSRLAVLTPALSAGVLTVALTLPLFFSGLAFSTELKRGTSVGVALSSNLLGAMLGGFLEYNAMYFGFRSLYVVALVLYACAFFSSLRGASFATNNAAAHSRIQ